MKRYGSKVRPLRRAASTTNDDTASTKQAIDPEHALQQLRIHVFNQAIQTLSIVKTLNEEASTMHPNRDEINEALKVVRKALIEAGLDILRPIVVALKRVDVPADAGAHGSDDNATSAVG